MIMIVIATPPFLPEAGQGEVLAPMGQMGLVEVMQRFPQSLRLLVTIPIRGRAQAELLALAEAEAVVAEAGHLTGIIPLEGVRAPRDQLVPLEELEARAAAEDRAVQQEGVGALPSASTLAVPERLT